MNGPLVLVRNYSVIMAHIPYRNPANVFILTLLTLLLLKQCSIINDLQIETCEICTVVGKRRCRSKVGSVVQRKGFLVSKIDPFMDIRNRNRFL